MKRYWNKYLSDNLIIENLNGTASKEDEMIFNRLKNIPINAENIDALKSRASAEKSEEYSAGNRLAEKMMEKYGNYKLSSPWKAAADEGIFDVPKPGEIWKAKRIPDHPGGEELEVSAETMYVYILSEPLPYLSDTVDEELVEMMPANYVVLALPISFNTEFASSNDLVIGGNNNILGLEFMIETDLEVNVIAGNLEKCEGRLNDEIIDALLNVYFKANGMEQEKEIDIDSIENIKTGDKLELNDSLKREFRNIENLNLSVYRTPVDLLDSFFEIDVDIIYEIDEIMNTAAEKRDIYSEIDSSPIFMERPPSKSKDRRSEKKRKSKEKDELRDEILKEQYSLAAANEEVADFRDRDKSVIYEFSIPKRKDFRFSFVFDAYKNLSLRISSACKYEIDAKFVMRTFDGKNIHWEDSIKDLCSKRIRYLPLRLKYGQKYYRFEIYFNNELAVTKKMKF